MVDVVVRSSEARPLIRKVKNRKGKRRMRIAKLIGRERLVHAECKQRKVRMRRTHGGLENKKRMSEDM